MKLRHLTPRDYARQAWKNGGGATTELAAFSPHPGLLPASGGKERFWWRVSIAEVATSGPFSDFTGYERTIMLLEGDGMELTFDQAPPRIIDMALKPYVFDGGWRTSCRLINGPVRDFNLMIDRQRAKGTLSIIPTSNLEVVHPWTLIYCIDGQAMIDAETLKSGDLLRVDAGEGSVLRITPSPQATLAAIRIAPC